MPKSQAPRKRVKSPAKKRDDNNQIMEDLKSIDKECQNMLNETAKFSPYLTNRELVESGNVEQIHDNSKILSRDTLQMKADLDAIRESIPKNIYPDNPNHVMKGLNIGDRYNEWQEKYQRAVLPTLERLGDLLKEAAGNMEKKEEVQSDDNA